MEYPIIHFRLDLATLLGLVTFVDISHLLRSDLAQQTCWLEDQDDDQDCEDDAL